MKSAKKKIINKKNGSKYISTEKGRGAAKGSGGAAKGSEPCPTLLKSPAIQHFLFLTWLRSYSAPLTSLFLASFVCLSSFLLYPFRLVDAPELPSRLGLLSVDSTLRSFISRTHKRTAFVLFGAFHVELCLPPPPFLAPQLAHSKFYYRLRFFFFREGNLRSVGQVCFSGLPQNCI